MKLSSGEKAFRASAFVILGVTALVMLVPFYNVVLISLSNPAAVAAQSVYLIPTVLDFSAYQTALSGTYIGNAFVVSLGVLFLGTSLNLALTLSAGYVLAKRHLPGVRFLTLAILFTMLFSGGLIPFYLTVRGLGLVDNLLVMIIPSALDTFLLIIAINYFKTIPASMEESAKIDGATDFQIMVRVIFPVAKPIVATLLLFYAVQRWNEWWLAMLFINDVHREPLQYVVRQLLITISSVINNSAGSAMADQLRNQSGDAVKMASVVISIVPVLCIYPFLTRYFNQGILLGSIKE